MSEKTAVRAASAGPPRFFCCPPPLLHLPRAGQLELEKRDRHHDQAKHHRLGLARALPAGTAVEGVIDVQRQKLRTVGGHAAREREVLVEELESVGQGQKRADGDGGHQHGQFDIAKRLPGGSAVNGGGLAQLSGNGLKAGNVDDHHVAGLLPEHHHHQAPEPVPFAGDQRNAVACEHAVVENDLPQPSQHDAADQVGHEKHRAEQVRAAKAAHQKQRHRQSEQVDHNRGQPGKQRRVPQRVRKAPRILKGAHIVAKAYKRSVGQGGEITERKVQPHGEGNQKTDGKGGRRRQQKYRPVPCKIPLHRQIPSRM